MWIEDNLNVILALASVGAVLAFGGYLWYTIRRSAALAQQGQELVKDTQAQEAKIKTLDDRIVDSEYRQRVRDKLDAKDATPDRAAELLTKASGGDGSTP